MNEIERNERRERIERFQIDDPTATHPFSAKLAKEQNWPSDFTQRAIREYKRFAYLAVASGHPVSPSPIVDEVWHLHLTYSKNYWEVFCPEILGRPFHHHPSGGPEEAQKYKGWYEKTLASYEEHFGEVPPPDIWPQSSAQSPGLDFEVIQRSTHWVIPKPRLGRHGKWAGIVALGSVGLGCSESIGINVFDWQGPDFLGFYLLFAGAGLSMAIWLRSKLRLPDEGVVLQARLDGYDLAYLNDGRLLAVNAGLAGLAKEGVITVREDGIVVATGAPLQSKHPLDRRIFEAVGLRGRRKIADIRKELEPEVLRIRDRLREQSLLVPDEYAGMAVWGPLSVGLTAVMVGVIKIGIGISRDRPVAFLVILTIVTLIITLAALAKRPHRSRFGDRVLAEEKLRFAQLKQSGRNVPMLAQSDVVLGVGLFGLMALQYSSLDPLRTRLQPQNGSSSCGGSGGGDGGGGGGCGGCGGCGS